MSDDLDPRPRHLLSAEGLDDPSDPSTPVRVTVVIPAETAHLVSTQQLAWLLVTMLARSGRAVVDEIVIDCPAGQPLLEHVSPYPARDGALITTLLETESLAGAEASPVRVRAPGSEAPDVSSIELIVNALSESIPGGGGERAWYVTGNGWRGELTRASTRLLARTPAGQIAIGPYIAACLAAGHVFLSVRARDFTPQPMSIDAWKWTSDEPFHEEGSDGPGSLDFRLDCVLAGVGAVGTAFLLALWATAGAHGVIECRDADVKGIESTNLNRCLIFNASHIGHPKAETAADALRRPELSITGASGRAETIVTRKVHLVSAVDTPDARGALQDRYPASAIQASTRDLRLEVLRVDPLAGTACLRCYNPPATRVSDDELRAQLARAGSDQIARHADELGVDPVDVSAWADHGTCGVLGDQMLSRLRAGRGDRAEFSVGFVSVLAGALLAAQAMQDALKRSDAPIAAAGAPALTGHCPRFVFNMLDPHSPIAGRRAYRRDERCPACCGTRLARWRASWAG